LLAQKVKSMGYENVLIVTDSMDENLLLSARNLPNVNVCAVTHADPVSLIRHAHVLLTKPAMAKFEELLK
jgi:large subunit ribosomal protein L4